jgi:4Fe-4S ferredoxin
MECIPAKNLEPVIDRTRCEGKADCVTACPEQVFDIRVVSLEERELLPFVARMKLWVHGGKQAYASRATDCESCGACVTACPEKAITLRARAS